MHVYKYVYTMYIYICIYSVRISTHTVYYILYSLDLPSHTHPEFLQLCWDVMYHWQLNQKLTCRIALWNRLPFLHPDPSSAFLSLLA